MKSVLRKSGASSNLRDVQACLRKRLERIAPEAPLTWAWNHFYATYSAQLRCFVIRQGVPAILAEDVLQDVWLAVYLHLPRFDASENELGLRAWLYQLVRSKAVDVLRRRSREIACLITNVRTPNDAPELKMDHGTQLEGELDWSLMSALLTDFKRHVSETNYQLLEMRFVEKRSAKQIAQELGMTPAQVSCRLSRMMKKLRRRAAIFKGKYRGAGRLD